MSDGAEDTPVIKQPLSLLGKIKAGVKGFFKTALHYLPRGLIFTGAIFGASALLGATVGPQWDLLHAITPEFSAQHLLTVVGRSLLIGGLISGGVGAYQGIKAETARHNEALTAQGEELKRLRAKDTPLREHEIGAHAAEIVTAQTHLPLAAGKSGSAFIG